MGHSGLTVFMGVDGDTGGYAPTWMPTRII